MVDALLVCIFIFDLDPADFESQWFAKQYVDESCS